MIATDQDKLEPLDNTLNRSKLWRGIDYRIAGGGLALGIVLAVFRHWIAGPVIAAGIIGLSWWLLKDDVKRLKILFHAFGMSGYYDAGRRHG